MNDQIANVLTRLTHLTRVESVTWRRTDDPETFILVRPQGAITIGPAGTTNDPDYQLLYVRFTDGDGGLAFEFVEANSENELDRPLHALWDAVRDQTSGVGKAIAQWLEDLGSLEEPF